jgi:tRNA uridine 5-carboxymethylaminomethyl modification enzyme
MGERSAEILESAEISVKYEGYINREKALADKLNRLEHIDIQRKFDYSTLKSLSTEARQKLTALQPATIGQASRIPGVSPADIQVLLILLGR